MSRKATKKPMRICPVCEAGHYNATCCSKICAGKDKVNK